MNVSVGLGVFYFCTTAIIVFTNEGLCHKILRCVFNVEICSRTFFPMYNKQICGGEDFKLALQERDDSVINLHIQWQVKIHLLRYIRSEKEYLIFADFIMVDTQTLNLLIFLDLPINVSY